MTKTLKIITLLLASFVLFSCSNKANAQNNTTENANITTADYKENSADAINIAANDNNSKSKILVAYFSWGGNSKTAAEYAKEITGGDIFEIVPAQPYPRQPMETTEQAREELDNNYLPEIKNKINNLSSYDAIILCYPNWWGTMPQIVKRFLQDNDFSGKTIAPICTHEGSRMGRSLTDIKAVCPNSTITEGLAIRGANIGREKNTVRDWIEKIGINK
ncbi:flavodoxin [Brachyspira catarrhinii]|uniref:Flavodoxin n=1 Tax=Brachyspira catarrhinii TaxID=2528966 RepID=A0ABY2TQE2_9SPIR|nr:flavodoxin [Brachyspira catarrhinii]TKZ35106.1 flavodoxin [Brachyspira catarrhinii]